MHNGDELRSEPGLYITGDMLDCRCDGIPSSEWGVHDDAKVFDLQVSLIQGFEGAAIIKVMIEWDGEVWVGDGSD